MKTSLQNLYEKKLRSMKRLHKYNKNLIDTQFEFQIKNTKTSQSQTYLQGRRENRGYRGYTYTPCRSERTGGRQGVILVVFFELR